MAFPTINFKYNGLEEAEKLAGLVEKKITAFEKFLTGNEDITCDVEFEKVAPRKHGQVHRVELNLMVDGTLYRAEAVEESFEKAIDEVRNEIDKELRRAKDKHSSLLKRAGRKIKESLNGFNQG